jgi:uncharacterized protein
VKIDVNQIPDEGLTLLEEVTPSELDLETEAIEFDSPIRLRAEVSKISNAVSVNLTWDALMHTNCSRCLNEFEIDFKKNIELNYPVDNSNPVIDLNTDIREEIILDYPLKPLCSPRCKGLCPKCGKNLNEGGCSCGTT